MLVDTDVLIWAMRGKSSASDYLDTLPTIFISDVTFMELAQGTRSKKELKQLRDALAILKVQRLPINTLISQAAVELVNSYTHSHAMQLADALIAATALTHELPLASGNRKHYAHIPDLNLHPFNV